MTVIYHILFFHFWKFWTTFPEDWIERDGPTTWLCSFPCLNTLDVYLWGYLKSTVYSAEFSNLQDVQQQIQNLRKVTSPPLYINQSTIPQTDTVKYLGLHFDKRLTWREHVTKTRKYLDLKTREMIWLIGKHSPLSLTNKLLIYKTVLKPIWTYGLAIWGCAAASSLSIIQRYQTKILWQITNAPRYVTNHTLHKDLRIPQVQTVLQELTDTHRTALQSHPNTLMAQILAPPNSRRLQRRWTLDVIT